MALQAVMNGKARVPIARVAVAWIKDNLSEGDLLTHEKLGQLVNEKRGPFTAYSRMVSITKRLLLTEHGVALKSRLNEGYTLCKGWEQIEHGTSYMKRASRSIRRGCQVIGAVQDHRLTQVERHARDYMLSNVMTLAEVSRNEARKMKLIIGKPDMLPQ